MATGCSRLPLHLIDQARRTNSKVILCDSQEMLSQLPDGLLVEKVEGPFPDCWTAFSKYMGSMDTIIAYSVFHYVVGYGKQYEFLNRCLDLLSHGGQLLMGDLPNYSKRARFFQSPVGIEFHQKYTGLDELPEISRNEFEKNNLDDALIFALVSHARKQGFDAYVVPRPRIYPWPIVAKTF